MNQIYLEVLKSHQELQNGGFGPSLRVTLDTYVASFVLCYCKDIPCKINLVETTFYSESDEYLISEELIDTLNIEQINYDEIPEEVKDCSMPVLYSKELKTCIAGLSGVLRFAIKSLLQNEENHYCSNILGYHNGCLAACSEVSVWTRFCEKDIQQAVHEILNQGNNQETKNFIMPQNLCSFEEHLSLPVKTHNILKRKQDLFKKKNVSAEGSDGVHPLIATSNFSSITKDCNNLELNHAYFAGIDRTLADFIMLPCIYLMFNYFQSTGIKYSENLPMVCSWYSRMLSDINILNTSLRFKWIQINFDLIQESLIDVVIPEVTNKSLYLRDANRSKIRIKHKDPTPVINKLLESSITPLCTSCPSIMDEGLDWHSLPMHAHPAGGDLPLSRVDRKCQQVESMVTAAMDLACPDDIVVDFCAGGGHVGILLAYYLPKCKIIMVENKEASAQRARERASDLQLDNVYFYQCNLNHFNGKFDLAVTLHACGVATDLVLEKALKQRAKFVCCPCCYGSIHEISSITYPRSQLYKDAKISAEEYLLLCHYADRTEVDTPSESQGKYCMGLIDTDRALYFEERNYTVRLCTLKPPDCTPKSNLLIGIPL